MMDKQLIEALMKVVSAVREYLPPNGISELYFQSRVIEAVDNPSINPVIAAIEVRAQPTTAGEYSYEVLKDTYEAMHEAATGMGYPSVTEALEHLSELRTAGGEPFSVSDAERVFTMTRHADAQRGVRQQAGA